MGRSGTAIQLRGSPFYTNRFQTGREDKPVSDEISWKYRGNN